MPGADVGGLLRSAVAALCLAAGVLHLSAAADHRGMAGHVAFFLIVAVVQSALAPVVLWAGRPGRWLVAATAVNLAVVTVWAFSRTTGVAVDGSSASEAIGFKDGITTLLELGAAAGAGSWWLLPEASRRITLESRRLATAMLGTGVWVFGAAGLFAGHTHSPGHTHDRGHAHDAGQAHTAAEVHDTDAHAHPHPADAISASAPAAPDHDHDRDHDGAHDQDGVHDPVAAQATAAHQHGPAARTATHGAAEPHAHSHAHPDAPAAGPSAAHQRHDHAGPATESTGEHSGHDHPSSEQSSPETERREDDEDSSLLDEVLKLIQPR